MAADVSPSGTLARKQQKTWPNGHLLTATYAWHHWGWLLAVCLLCLASSEGSLLRGATTGCNGRPIQCQPFWTAPEPRNIAIVGNGPLGLEDRKALKHFDLVMRFNHLDNAYCNDALDIWLLREAPTGPLGIARGRGCEAAQMLAKARSLWLVGGTAAELQAVQMGSPAPAVQSWVHFPLQHWLQRYGVPGKQPSLGWIGLTTTLECAHPSATVHLFGFNWANRSTAEPAVPGPPVDAAAERAFVAGLAATGRVTVHPTPCAAYSVCMAEGPDKLVLAGRDPNAPRADGAAVEGVEAPHKRQLEALDPSRLPWDSDTEHDSPCGRLVSAVASNKTTAGARRLGEERWMVRYTGKRCPSSPAADRRALEQTKRRLAVALRAAYHREKGGGWGLELPGMLDPTDRVKVLPGQ